MRVLLIAFTLGACHGWLGLDETAIGGDRDGDGVFDDVDNCIGVANADQLDFDSDGIGNACEQCDDGLRVPTFRDIDLDMIDDGCDPCPLGRDVDEDGDDTADACDSCPGVANVDATDTDLDKLGDACDPSVEAHNRRYFEGFATDLRAWTSPIPWRIVDGAAEPTAVPSKLELYAVRLTGGGMKIPPVGVWSASVGLELPPTITSTSGVGIELFGTQFEYARCGILFANNRFVLELAAGGGWGDSLDRVATADLGASLPQRVMLQVRRGPTDAQSDNFPYALQCSVDDITVELPGEHADLWRIRLEAGFPARFTYVDTISNQGK